MIPARQHLKGLSVVRSTNPVHQSVLARDPSRASDGEVLPQRLRPASAGERVSPAFLDQNIDPLQDLAVGLLPAEILGSAFGIENDLQG
jgi:hypothetical protein